MTVHPHVEREKNVFYQIPGLKARIIELPAGGEMPTCEMASYVIFYLIEGSAEITVNNEKVLLTEGQCLITDPATLAMKTEEGVRIMGIQVNK